MIFGVVLLATALVVAGYLVLHFSTQAQGRIQSFGKYLSYWVFLLAAVVVVGALTAPVFGVNPFGMRMMMRDRDMMGDYGRQWMGERRPGAMMERPRVREEEGSPQSPSPAQPQTPANETAAPPSQ